MVIVLRTGVWILAVLLAAGPTIINVAPSPGRIANLLHLSAYLDSSRDLLFLAVAILVIGIVDALESIVSMLEKKTIKPMVLTLSLLMLIILLPQLVLYCMWSAPSVSMAGLDVQEMPSYVGGSAICAFASRLTLALG